MPWPHLSALLHFYLKPVAGAAVWIILVSSPSSFIFSLLANSPDVYFRSPLGTSHSPAGISPLPPPALISICVALFFVLVLLISIFSLLELSCKLYVLVWQYGAVKSLSHSHSHSFLVTVENFQSVLCQCRGWWCAVRLWRWTNAFIVALMQSLPPCISSITTQFQIHVPLLWTSCNIFFLLQLCYCNDLSLQFLQTHFLHSHYLFNFHTYSHFCLFPRSSSDSIISSFCPVHLISIMLHTCHDCSLSLLILRNFD